MAETTLVRSIENVKHDGEWHLPGTVWPCPTAKVKALVAAGSVERNHDESPVQLAPISDMKKADIIKELKQRDIMFGASEGIDDLREVLSMARESIN